MAVVAMVMLVVVLAGCSAPAPLAPAEARPPVILLHGLARSPASMSALEEALAGAGFAPCNIGYPSTDHPVEVLARDHVLPAIRTCLGDAAGAGGPIHFVTHSMGGIVLRQLVASGTGLAIGRAVMLGPPNAGSELVDRLGDGGLSGWMFDWINGPAGRQLGTEASSLPNRLGPAAFEVGVIAGDEPWLEPFAGWIAGPSDGKVAVERTRLAGMSDFLVLPVTHALMMRDDEVIAQTIVFLKTGHFNRPVRIDPPLVPAQPPPQSRPQSPPQSAPPAQSPAQP